MPMMRKRASKYFTRNSSGIKVLNRLEQTPYRVRIPSVPARARIHITNIAIISRPVNNNKYLLFVISNSKRPPTGVGGIIPGQVQAVCSIYLRVPDAQHNPLSLSHLDLLLIHNNHGTIPLHLDKSLF